jgi:transposase
MKTTSVELRQRILAAYDQGESTRQQIAKRFRVSEGLLKKLLQQRRLTGDIAPRHHLSGRKPKILPSHQTKLRTLLAKDPTLTLDQLRRALRLDCSLPAIHHALSKLGLTRKKKPAKPARTPSRKARSRK